MAASAAARLVSLKVVFASRPASAAHGRPVSPAAPATATAAAAAAFAADFYSSCTKSGVLAAAFRNSGHRQHRLQGELLLLGSEPAAAATATTAWADADLSLVPGFLKQRRRLHISAFRWQGEIPGQPLQGEQPVAAVAAPTAAASAVGALHSAAYAGIGVRAVSGATGAPLQLRSGFAASPPVRLPRFWLSRVLLLVVLLLFMLLLLVLLLLLILLLLRTITTTAKVWGCVAMPLQRVRLLVGCRPLPFVAQLCLCGSIVFPFAPASGAASATVAAAAPATYAATSLAHVGEGAAVRSRLCVSYCCCYIDI